MKIYFTELAKSELNDAIVYYEIKSPGLGKSFKGEVASAARRISQYPQAWSIERGTENLITGLMTKDNSKIVRLFPEHRQSADRIVHMSSAWRSAHIL